MSGKGNIFVYTGVAVALLFVVFLTIGILDRYGLADKLFDFVGIP